MSKPVPIIHTRVPAALQQVFIKANRGEVVHVPPDAVCRNWKEERDQRKEAKKIRKSASFPDLIDLSETIDRYEESRALDEEASLVHVSVFLDSSTDFSDVSSHCSTDDSTTFEPLPMLPSKSVLFSRWDAEYSPTKKNSNKLPPFRRPGSSRWEFKTTEEGNGIPKMPMRH